MPRVILCGNRRFLDPVCEELLRRGARVWWFYDRFAAGSWLRWRGRGVGQLVCDSSQGRVNRFAAVDGQLPEGFDETLAPAVREWLRRMSHAHGARQTRMIEQIGAQFDRVRPTVLITDEDATPLPRAAIAAARLRGAASVVVQHGAPCVRFGFAPLAADRICVWGESSRQQLLRWGVEESRIAVTGPVGSHHPHPNPLPEYRERGPSFLLLATTPARDERPDAVGFHLTRRTHAEMLRVAFACISRIPGARLTIKLHPRARDASLFTHLLRQSPTLRAKVIRGGRLDQLVSRADCVLSCASSSGVEAAARGAPVIQLLPLGSGDILPANEWGFLGSARTEAELDRLLKSSRHIPFAVASRAVQRVFHDPPGSARRIVDVALSTSREFDRDRAEFNPLHDGKERNEFRSTQQTEAAA